MSKGTSAKGRLLLRGTFVYKAQALQGQTIPDMILSATKPVPETKTLEESADVLLADAQKIVEALKGSLPGGTLDRVAALLLLDKASGLVVREQDIPGRPKRRALKRSRT